MTAEYAVFESNPARYAKHEAWVLIDKTWTEYPVAEVKMGARPMTKAAFDKLFGDHLPALPTAAFQDAE